jgi:hypothetical protein
MDAALRRLLNSSLRCWRCCLVSKIFYKKITIIPSKLVLLSKWLFISVTVVRLLPYAVVRLQCLLSRIESIRGASYWTTGENSWELLKLSSRNKVKPVWNKQKLDVSSEGPLSRLLRLATNSWRRAFARNVEFLLVFFPGSNITTQRSIFTLVLPTLVQTV